MHPLASFAASRYGHLAGTSGTATVPTGGVVVGLSCYSSGGGTLVITPGGANQTGTAQPTITIPAGTTFEPAWLSQLGILGAGTTFVFTGTDAYVVPYLLQRAGA